MNFSSKLLLLLVFASSCKARPVGHAFYYWQTRLWLDDSVNIAKTNTDHFYLRFMDVDWSDNEGMPVPRGKLELPYRMIPINYTPVIYITNRTFERMADDWVDTLATRLTTAIGRMSAGVDTAIIAYKLASANIYGAGDPRGDSIATTVTAQQKAMAKEIQLDCDWSTGTRDKYFRFLKLMKQRNPGKEISVTVRMYPYKYRTKMGIPPADRAMLMCYNLGNIRSAGTTNSIFQLEELARYIDAPPYPLPVDVALPLFRWQVWSRGGKFRHINHKVLMPDSASASFTTLSPGRFRINVDTVIDDEYYREGDELRTEAPDPGQLVQAASLLRSHISDYRRIAFFDWSNETLSIYDKTIQAVFNGR